MRVAIRADASPSQGAGHVMRSITLAKSLSDQGFDVTFASSITNVPWLSKYVMESGISVKSVPKNSLQQVLVDVPPFDLVVVDSYEIPSKDISFLNTCVPVLAIIDGFDRGIEASIFLDQNLGSEVNVNNSSYLDSLVLFGSKYTLVRREVLEARRIILPKPRALEERKLLVFLGGTDPNNYVVEVAGFLARTAIKSITFIAPRSLHEEILKLMLGRNCKVLEFTQELPKIIAQFDAVISASGTSAWDIATIGTPGGFLCVAENQQESISTIERFGVGLGLGNLTKADFDEQHFISAAESLVYDDEIRSQLFRKCRENFDGKGSIRVTDAVLTYL